MFQMALMRMRPEFVLLLAALFLMVDAGVTFDVARPVTDEGHRPVCALVHCLAVGAHWRDVKRFLSMELWDLQDPRNPSSLAEVRVGLWNGTSAFQNGILHAELSPRRAELQVKVPQVKNVDCDSRVFTCRVTYSDLHGMEKTEQFQKSLTTRDKPEVSCPRIKYLEHLIKELVSLKLDKIDQKVDHLRTLVSSSRGEKKKEAGTERTGLPTERTTASPDSPSLDFTASYTEGFLGGTKTLELKCAARHAPAGSVNHRTAIALVIRKLSNNLQKKETFLRLNPATREINNKSIKGNQVVGNGKLNDAGLTHGSILWRSPSSEADGKFECEVVFVTHDFKIVRKRAEVKVELTSPELPDVASAVRTLSQLTNRLQNRVDKLETSAQKVHKALFRSSELFQGRRYLLSHHQSPTASEAQDICEAFGGYLAEIQSDEEYSFVERFLFKHGPYALTTSILLGATDEGHEGKWIFRHSKKDVTYRSRWDVNNAHFNGLNEHCMSLRVNGVTRTIMNDMICGSNSWSVSVRFLCAVPS